MSKLVAMYSVLNVQDLIYESLTSVARAVDEIRVYDGRFSDYRCPCGIEHDNSCDNTFVEIEAWQREYPEAPPFELVQWQAMPEMQKRTKMMQDVPVGTCTLTLDDEELLFGRSKPLRDFAARPTSKAAYIDCLFAEAGHGTGAVIPLARLVMTTPGLKYDSYYKLEDDEGLVVDMKADNVGIPYGHRNLARTYIHPSTRLAILWHYRSQKRDKASRDYNNVIAPRGWK